MPAKHKRGGKTEDDEPSAAGRIVSFFEPLGIPQSGALGPRRTEKGDRSNSKDPRNSRI